MIPGFISQMESPLTQAALLDIVQDHLMSFTLDNSEPVVISGFLYVLKEHLEEALSC